MKNLKKILLLTLLACNIYAGDSAPPSAAVETFDASNFAFGSDVESIESGNVDFTINGDKTGVALWNVMGRYFNRETSSITGDDEYGLYTLSNSQTDLSLLSLENYGNISSEHGIGLNMVGINGILNNYDTGHIYGSSLGVMIDPEAGTSIYNGFEINNYGQIESAGIGIYQMNEKQDFTLYNAGYIDAVNYGTLLWGRANVINDGEINSYYTAAMYLLNGGTVTNNGSINGLNGEAIKSKKLLTLKGSGSYRGDITYNGTAEQSMIHSFLLLDNINIDLANGRLKDWNNIYVIGGENYFNVEYANFQNYNSDYRSNVYVSDGAILHTGSGDNGNMNLTIENGVVNPYENSYDTNGNYFWNRYAHQGDGVQYYERREYEKLTVNNLTILDNGGLVIDIKNSKPYYSYDYYVEDGGTWDSKHTNLDGTYGGYGYAAFKGTPFPKYHRINHDTVDVRGTATIASGATLYLVDHTLESLDNEAWLDDGEAFFLVYSHLEIDALDGNIRFKDFSNIKFYSDIYGIDYLDNATGIAHLTLDAFDTDEYHLGIIDWWIQEAEFGFAEAPVLTPQMAPMAMSYQVAKDYNIKITDLASTTALQNAIYGFTSWDDVDSFLDDINKMEYASLATSNLNAISNRVDNIYTQLQNDYLRDANGYSFWFDTYVFDDSLSGSGDHDIDGNGYEVTVGFDKQFNDAFKLGFSFNHIDYSTNVNDSGFHTTIDSEGYGGNVFAQYKQGALTHTAMLGYGQYTNNDDVIADFDSSEVFTSYRAEYAVNKNITLIGGLRYASVTYDNIEVDSENGLKGFTHDSLQTELGVRASKQFKKLNVSVSASWMHELANAQNSSTAYTSFGEFDQKGISRDSDSYRVAVGASYQLTEKMSIGVEAAKEMSANSDSNSIAAKFRITF